MSDKTQFITEEKKSVSKKDLAKELLAQNKSFGEIQAQIKAKFGDGLSNTILTNLKKEVDGKYEAGKLKIFQFEVEEVRMIKDFEPRRLRIVFGLQEGQSYEEALFLAQDKISEGFQLLKYMSERLNEFYKLKLALRGVSNPNEADVLKDKIAKIHDEIRGLIKEYRAINLSDQIIKGIN